MKRTVGSLLYVLIVTTAFGHEGHQPLPTRGVQVDLKTGRISLSRSSRELLDVQTVAVERRESTERLRAYATIVAPWTKYAVVTSRLPGRVVALHVRPGDLVEAGQLLAEVDSLDLHTLRLDYQQARNDIDLSERILADVEPAAKAGSISGQKLIEAQQAHRQNLNTLQVLKAKAAALNLAEATLSTDDESRSLRLPIRSTIGGIVAHADLAVGKFIEPTEHLMDIVDLSTVWVKIGVLERDWHRVATGNTVRLAVSALPGRVFETKVDRLGLLLDPRTHQSIAWAEITNPLKNPPSGLSQRNDASSATESNSSSKVADDALNRRDKSDGGEVMLRPGMNGQAELSWHGQKPILTVPSEAVLSDGAERYVLVEESATKDGAEYQKVAVVVGRQSAGQTLTRSASEGEPTASTVTRSVSEGGRFTEIIAGKLLPGDRVVIRGGHELSSLFFLGVLRIGAETARTIGLKVEPVAPQVVDRILSLDGALDVPPQRRTTASAQLDGKLVNIRVDRSQSVKTGEVLGEIASLELQDIQLELLRNHLDGELWSGTMARLRTAGESVPRRLLLETEGRVRTLNTKSASLRQKLLTLGLSAAQIDGVLESKRVVDALPVRAPIDGAVVDFNRKLGEVVRADEPLFAIHDLSQVWVQAFVGERDSARVQVGQTARVRLVAHPDMSIDGLVARIGPVVGADSRTQAAWIEIQKPPSLTLQHNIAARITLTSERPAPTLAVPLNAVVRDGLRSFVFVKKTDGTFDRRRIELGRADDRFVEIKSGLTRGEMIATSGVSQIQTAYAAVR